MQALSSFQELFLQEIGQQSGFVYESDKTKQFLSYPQFWKQVEENPIADVPSVGIFCDGSLTTLVSLFSYVHAKKRVILLDPYADESVLKKQIEATNPALLLGPEALVEAYSGLYQDRGEEIHPDILFFTSGTTSSSKAVVLTEQSLCRSAYNGSYCLPLKPEDILLSILPWNHVFGFVCGILWGVECGASVALSRGRRHFYDDCSYFQPTAVSFVPQMAGFLLMKNLLNPELKLILIGAGDCPDEVLYGLKQKGIRVSFGYGLTETSSGIALSLGDDPRKMTICPDCKLVLGPDKEILVHAPLVWMQGYYQDKESTKKTIYDGYLHTGDLGFIDDQGLLSITGRKKEILLLSDGTKIFLPEFEGELKKILGEELAVLQNRKGQLILALERNVDGIVDKLNEFNLRHPRSARISRLFVLNHPFPRTATGKIKRYQINTEQN